MMRSNLFPMLRGGLFVVFLGAWSLPAIASIEVIVNETFDGYSQFPDEKPRNDPVNLGVPTIAKGTDSGLWLAARFETPDARSSSISKDVGVQKFGGGGNNSHVGRAGDDAGLVLRLDLTGYMNVMLSFEWRTFLAETTDRFVVAYYTGDGLGTPNGVYDWFNDPLLGNGDMSTPNSDGSQGNTWYENNWTELLRASQSNTFQSESFMIPDEDTNDIVYLAFWLDNGDKDFAKFDNIVVKGKRIPPVEPPPPVVPEPLSFFVWSMLAICAGSVSQRSREG